MKLKSLLLVCVVLSSTVTLCAQSSGTAAELLSGTWTGDMGPSAANRFPLKLELKFDGQAAVSGTVTGPPLPGEIKSGSFDPKTGALKLEVDVKGDGAVSRFVFEGTVVSGMATGRVNGDSQTGNFKITKGGATGGAQPPGANETAAALRHGFGEVSGWVTKAADLVPADKYSYRPAPSVRTFGQQIAHIAVAYNYYCARATGQKAQWSDAIEKGNTDKATLVQTLKQATDSCNAAYGSGQAGMLMANIAHTNLHYGNIITYLRMLGLTPPSN